MDARSLHVTELLLDLSRSVESIVSTLKNAVGTIRLPVTESLSGVAQAAENAALKVLDEAEALQEDQSRLSTALARLRELMPADDLIALAIWQEADECSSALSARAAKFISAMEFQDLASQHINHSVDAIETVRTRLSAVLEYFGLTVTGEQESTERPRSLAVLGRADQVHGERQAAADEIIAGLR